MVTSRLLVRGRIFTSDPELPWAEAMAVDGDTITHVGTVADATMAAGPDAEVIDAGDGVVIPGFVDGHAHLVSAGAALTKAVLRPCNSFDEIATELRRWWPPTPTLPACWASAGSTTPSPAARPPGRCSTTSSTTVPSTSMPATCTPCGATRRRSTSSASPTTRPTPSAARSCATSTASPPVTCRRTPAT